MPTRIRSPLSGGQGIGRSALLLGLALVAGTTPAGAQRPNEPPYFAIRDARIVPVSGPVIPKGTIVIANGVISAVGTRVAVPPEAWVIDGEGLTVSPGLGDALSTLGLPAPEGEGRGEARRDERPREFARGPEDRPATTPWVNAADLLDPEDKRLEIWRKAGFTSAVTVPEEGIFAGQAAWIDLAGERASEMVVKTPVALRLNLTPTRGFRSFPGSLMGVLAYIEQVFLDASHYAQAWSLYETNPRGQERPEYDRALDPVQRAVAERRPVLLPATWAKEIDRSLRLGDEIGAQTIVYGAHQGYEVAGILAARKTPVLVSAKWPEREKDADPELEEPLRVLRFRERAPSTPASLHEAGVRFAFYSEGLTNPQDVLRNVRQAIDAGLPSEAALRALTLSPAEIYGVADRLGSLEVGKIANVIVTDGDLFDEKTKVKMVFIDGRRYAIREPGRPAAPPAVVLTGRWTLTVSGREGPEEITAELTMAEDGGLSGSVTGPRGTARLTEGWVSGTRFQFTVSVPRAGRSIDVTYSGTVEGERMSGTRSAGRFSTDFTGQRVGGAPEPSEPPRR